MKAPGESERIAFLLIRGIVALALVAAGVYCVKLGVDFFALPRPEAEGMKLTLYGFDVSAGGLGSVVFTAGIVICFLAARTAPRRHSTEERKLRKPRKGGGYAAVETVRTIVNELDHQ